MKIHSIFSFRQIVEESMIREECVGKIVNKNNCYFCFLAAVVTNSLQKQRRKSESFELQIWRRSEKNFYPGISNKNVGFSRAAVLLSFYLRSGDHHFSRKILKINLNAVLKKSRILSVKMTSKIWMPNRIYV